MSFDFDYDDLGGSEDLTPSPLEGIGLRGQVIQGLTDGQLQVLSESVGRALLSVFHPDAGGQSVTFNEVGAALSALREGRPARESAQAVLKEKERFLGDVERLITSAQNTESAIGRISAGVAAYADAAAGFDARPGIFNIGPCEFELFDIVEACRHERGAMSDAEAFLVELEGLTGSCTGGRPGRERIRKLQSAYTRTLVMDSSGKLEGTCAWKPQHAEYTALGIRNGTPFPGSLKLAGCGVGTTAKADHPRLWQQVASGVRATEVEIEHLRADLPPLGEYGASLLMSLSRDDQGSERFFYEGIIICVRPLQKETGLE